MGDANPLDWDPAEIVIEAIDALEMYCLLALREPELEAVDMGIAYLATALIYLNEAIQAAEARFANPS